MSVIEKLDHLNKHIQEICLRVNRDPSTIQIIAVTKYVDEEVTKAVLDAGVIHIGENRPENGVQKWEALHDRGVWHFIGSLQSRKVKKIIGKFDYIHSLDRLTLAEELDKRQTKKDPIKCFVQVNVSGEETKAGLEPNEVIPFIRQLENYPTIEVVGLMTMAPFFENPERTRPVFQALKVLRDEVHSLQLPFAPCTELSMGMSNDYEIAIEEGATFIRIGSAIVG
ncbi:YggS family pyridoxal phosphate-dependent enzyme [Bacillus solitudinis]|uniref:YggS family pyridoxal phosphate-dependent enzyme n=1 Tax=Bacillus solitudinis TaxID=2014074 RepID=UPI000C24E680|nr:YggS family pyridoxal phosphate-dependent enzyme [Bacillus solitudinis]